MQTLNKSGLANSCATSTRYFDGQPRGQTEPESHSDVKSDVQTNFSFETALTSVSASYCPEEMQTRSVEDSRNPIGPFSINDDMDEVTLSTDVESDKTVNDDTLTETDVDVSEGEGLATISRNNENVSLLPQCSNTLRRPQIEIAPKCKELSDIQLRINRLIPCQVPYWLAEILLL